MNVLEAHTEAMLQPQLTAPLRRLAATWHMSHLGTSKPRKHGDGKKEKEKRKWTISLK
jgi:hypothetical protein